MTETKKQLFQAMIDAISAYKEHCAKDNGGFHIKDEMYDEARSATSAYAQNSGISYERACKLALEYIGC